MGTSATAEYFLFSLLHYIDVMIIVASCLDRGKRERERVALLLVLCERDVWELFLPRLFDLFFEIEEAAETNNSMIPTYIE